MNEHHFKIDAPFATVVDALLSSNGVDIAEHSEMHCIGTLDGGAGLIARPAYLDATDIIVAEPDGDLASAGFADRLARSLGCTAPVAHPFEPV